MNNLIENYQNPYRKLSRLVSVLLISLVFMSLIFLTGAMGYSTRNDASPLIDIRTTLARSPSDSGLFIRNRLVDDGSQPARSVNVTPSNFAPFVNIVPSQDGTELFINVGGVGELGGEVYANLLGIGPSAGKGGWTMTYSETIQTYFTQAVGFTPRQDDDGEICITTTLGLVSDNIAFQRAFIETSATETIKSDDGKFIVDLPNLNTLPNDAYLVVMSTNVPPGPLPFGYQFASETFAMRPSGGLTESDRFMTLTFNFQEPLPNNSDPHTLAVVFWDQVNNEWQVRGGNLFDDQKAVVFSTRQFGIHAMAVTPNWRDSFQESSLSGVATQINTQWGPGETIILASNTLSGTITSIPITPPTIDTWETLHFSATTTLSSSVTVDLLDLNDNVVLPNVSDGADLSSLSVTLYPSLKLRATLSRTTIAEASPKLHEWSLGWAIEERKLYLPLLVKSGV